MVVVHIVLFDFSGAAEDKVAACLAALATLRSIPGVSAVSYGATFTQRGKHFTHALTVTLVDKAALEAYAPHPGAQLRAALQLRGCAALVTSQRPLQSSSDAPRAAHQAAITNTDQRPLRPPAQTTSRC